MRLAYLNYIDLCDEEIHQKFFFVLTLTEKKIKIFLLYTPALYKQPQKIVVLTGGNKGIGLGVLRKLLECEMTVVLGK